jgi:hypothetical protein
LVITVTAFNVAGDGIPNSGDGTDQDFALVCYNCAEDPGFTLSVTPGSQSLCTLDETQAVYQVSVGSILGYNTAATLSASGQPAGSSVSFSPNPVIPAGSSTLTVGGIGAGLSGSYNLAIEGENADMVRSTGAALTLAASLPGKAVLQDPANNAKNQPLFTVFSWTPVSQAASYEIQIAADGEFVDVVDSNAGIAGTTYIPPAGLESGRTYFWRVRAENACGDGAFSEVFTFTTESLPGDCPVGTVPSVLYQTDFEAGSTGWSHSGIGDTWTISNGKTHSGSNAFHGTDVSSISDQVLVSPQVILPAGQSPLSLQFWNYQAIESNILGSLCYDGAILEISSDGGNSWFQVSDPDLLTDPYQAPVSGSFGNPLAGKDAWCGDPQDWLNSIVDLDDYAGQAVRFRFRLGTDGTASREGWYIDDVVVQSCQVEEGVTVGPDQTHIGKPGGTAEFAFNITNVGASPGSYSITTDGEWEASLSADSTGPVSPGHSVQIHLSVAIPESAQEGDQSMTAVTVQSETNPAIAANAQAITWVWLLDPYFMPLVGKANPAPD